MNPNREIQPFPDPTRPWTEAVVEYHANPLESRSVKDFVGTLGIHVDTYYKFMRVNKEAVYKEADRRRKKATGAVRATAWRKLVARFDKSDKALEMFFKMSGDLVERSEQRVEYTTPEQKRDRVKKLLDELSGKSKND